MGVGWGRRSLNVVFDGHARCEGRALADRIAGLGTAGGAAIGGGGGGGGDKSSLSIPMMRRSLDGIGV
jgi:hypothetical protein